MSVSFSVHPLLKSELPSIPAFLGSAHVILVFSSYFLRISCYFLSYFSSYSGCLVSTMRRRKPTSSIILQENNETFLRQHLRQVFIIYCLLRYASMFIPFFSTRLNSIKQTHSRSYVQIYSRAHAHSLLLSAICCPSPLL